MDRTEKEFMRLSVAIGLVLAVADLLAGLALGYGANPWGVL